MKKWIKKYQTIIAIIFTGIVMLMVTDGYDFIIERAGLSSQNKVDIKKNKEENETQKVYMQGTRTMLNEVITAQRSFITKPELVSEIDRMISFWLTGILKKTEIDTVQINLTSN